MELFTYCVIQQVEDPVSSDTDDVCSKPLEPSENKEQVLMKIESHAGFILSYMSSLIACNDLPVENTVKQVLESKSFMILK